MKVIKKYYVLIITVIFLGSSALLAYFTPQQEPSPPNPNFTGDGDVPERVNYNYYWAKPAHKNQSPVKNI